MWRARALGLGLRGGSRALGRCSVMHASAVSQPSDIVQATPLVSELLAVPHTTSSVALNSLPWRSDAPLRPLYVAAHDEDLWRELVLLEKHGHLLAGQVSVLGGDRTG
jgi:hypothetical protein